MLYHTTNRMGINCLRVQMRIRGQGLTFGFNKGVFCKSRSRGSFMTIISFIWTFKYEEVEIGCGGWYTLWVVWTLLLPLFCGTWLRLYWEEIYWVGMFQLFNNICYGGCQQQIRRTNVARNFFDVERVVVCCLNCLPYLFILNTNYIFNLTAWLIKMYLGS